MYLLLKAFENVCTKKCIEYQWVQNKMDCNKNGCNKKAMFNTKCSLSMHCVPILHNINKYSNIVVGGDSIMYSCGSWDIIWNRQSEFRNEIDSIPTLGLYDVKVTYFT